ncbi:hypothetical protein W911_09890 [Hyphomicrobium nitrativorans NL23]|uniref:Uncharacterized protein n=1 Tax=Hyphomicrobium nitrativorans NL23 TaxID=1029756 RepID=V5SF06_9HYPH|nr:hypothetical protein [Hyphomicrobium nitrativorans]AHB48630.1 hypothetical protein W911_09890 [Hyphomicrobium nitrativorans NL23]
MIIAKTLGIAASAALMVLTAVPAVQADSIAEVEGARAQDRQGLYLDREQRENLRRYGRNDDYGYRRGGYSSGYYDGPSIGIYVGPRSYYDPYGY